MLYEVGTKERNQKISIGNKSQTSEQIVTREEYQI
jgi:hypothetical protein